MARRGSGATGRRCAAEGCKRQVAAGRVLCLEHARGAYGREVEGAVGRLARRVEAAFAPSAPLSTGEEDGEWRRAGEEFRRRLGRGEYGGLFDGPLREVMAQAARERGVAEEIGALRVELARLLAAEGEDPLRRAHAVARLAGVTVGAVRAQRAIEGELGDGLTVALAEILAELDGE